MRSEEREDDVENDDERGARSEDDEDEDEDESWAARRDAEREGMAATTCLSLRLRFNTAFTAFLPCFSFVNFLFDHVGLSLACLRLRLSPLLSAVVRCYAWIPPRVSVRMCA